MRRLLLGVASLAAVIGLIGGFATPANAARRIPDIIVCVTEPCP